tara:strand:+ start:1463 stop:1903 length:441 start_codon:yes stop_codon:yes gene_type:complete
MPCDFDTSPGFLIDRNAHLLRLFIKQTLADLDLDLTAEEVAILIALETREVRRIGDLASLLLRDATTVTRQIEGLERKGCAERRPSETDRRVVEVFVTKKGHACFEKLDPVLDAKREIILAGISEPDLKTLTRCLQTIRENVLALS